MAVPQQCFDGAAWNRLPWNGDTWHDSTQHAQAYRQSGLTIYRPGLVYSQTASVSATIPAATAADLDSAVGGVASVITTFNSNAGYLYPILP